MPSRRGKRPLPFSSNTCTSIWRGPWLAARRPPHGTRRRAIQAIALATATVLGAAACYSSNYADELRANVTLLAQLSDKLADYCRAGFQLDEHRVSSEEMGEFYYGLEKARGFAAISASKARGRPSYQEFGALIGAYEAFLRAADHYRLASPPDGRGELDRIMALHARVEQKAAVTLRALEGEENRAR